MKRKVKKNKESFDVNDIIFFVEDNEYKEVVESIRRYLKWVYLKDKDFNWDKNEMLTLVKDDKDNKSLVEKLKEYIDIGKKKILVIVDFPGINSEFNGVQLVKRLRFLFPWGIRKEINNEEKKTGDNEKDYVFEFWPIIFLSLDRVWRFDVALKRANLISKNIELDEQKESILGKHFLPTLKNTYYLKIPEEINKLGELIQIAINVNLKLRISRQEAEAAYLAYDEHAGGHH